MKQTTLEEKSAGGVVCRAVHEISNPKFPARIASQNDAGGSNSQIKYEFLIGKHSGYHKWVLPKGLVERGESAPEAAVREVMEEVGVEARIIDLAPLKTIEYYYFADLGEVNKTRRVKKYQEDGGAKTRIHKQVVFYLMETENDLGREGWEMEERKWVSFEEGMMTLAFETEREVFELAGKVLGCSR